MPSVTINFDGAVATRLQAALEETFRPEDIDGNPIPADIAMLKQYIVNDLRQFVRTSERRVARKAAEASVVDVDVT